MSEPIQGNERQIEAIRFTQGPAMILAGPGSGKTFVTVERICYLITHHHIDPSDILVITFTKAAAREMQERFFRRMGKERPPVRFGTFHAIFYYILRQSAQYRDYTILTETEKRKLLRKILSMHKQFVSVREEDYENLIKEIGRYKNGQEHFGEQKELTEPSALPAEIKQEDFVFLCTEYQKYLREFRKMDFDDIGILCENLLTEDDETRRFWQAQFQYILVDEFQDIGPLQYRLVRTLSMPQDNLFVVGDDDQSIYGFRGACPLSMQQFQQDYPSCVQILLNVNYRCHESIVNAAQTMISENKERFSKQVIANHKTGAGFCCQIFQTREAEQIFWKEKFQKLMQEQKLDRTVVLCRTNLECTIQSRFLEKNRIPYRLKEPPRSRFEHFVIQDIITYLILGDGNRERRYFLRIINRPVRYLHRESLQSEIVRREELLVYYKGIAEMAKAIDSLFHGLEMLNKMKPSLAVRYIRNVVGYDRYLKEKYGGETLKDYLRIADEFQDFACSFGSIHELLACCAREEEEIREQRKEFYQHNREDKEKQGVQIMTVHASKGLEFDCVCIPACEEGSIPSKKSKEEREIEEERRMFYVAITRAKYELIITAVKSENGREKPSGFLEKMNRAP